MRFQINQQYVNNWLLVSSMSWWYWSVYCFDIPLHCVIWRVGGRTDRGGEDGSGDRQLFLCPQPGSEWPDAVTVWCQGTAAAVLLFGVLCDAVLWSRPASPVSSNLSLRPLSSHLITLLWTVADWTHSKTCWFNITVTVRLFKIYFQIKMQWHRKEKKTRRDRFEIILQFCEILTS